MENEGRSPACINFPRSVNVRNKAVLHFSINRKAATMGIGLFWGGLSPAHLSR